MSVTLRAGDRIGEYEVLAPLRTGGMAALYLGRRAGAAGFSKPVAIKVIHPHLASDPGFVEMFLDEARLSARIQDPNVVHVEDLGEADGMFYLAMEYVLGVPLSALLARMVQGGQRFEIPLACAIAMRVADGLHAAHELRDEAGAPLEVVHRDVSPQNILLSEAGHVKLIDFGVARARGRAHATEAGELKGKVRYMSPEQAWGRPIDRRTDVYALGVVLWELLVLRRYIEGTNDIEALELARAPTPIAPSTLRDDVPPALDEVVLTALRRDPDERFATAAAFRRALSNAVPEALKVEPADLAALIESQHAHQLAGERALLTPPARSSSPTDVTRDLVVVARASRAPGERASVSSAAAPPPVRDPRPRVPAWMIALGVLALVTAVGLVSFVAGWILPFPTSAPVPGPSAGPASPVEAPSDPCADRARLVVREGRPASLTIDTSAGAPRFALLGLRSPDGARAPDSVVEVEVEGEGRMTLEVSTIGPETDPRFDTIVAGFEGTCVPALRDARPAFSADDQGGERHARMVFAVDGGSTVTLVVSGFGVGLDGMTDRGHVGLTVTARPSTQPVLLSASAVSAGTAITFLVRGTDDDRDADRLRVRVFERGSTEPLAVRTRGTLEPLEEHVALLAHQESASVDGDARVLLPSADEAVVTRIARAEVVLLDRAGNASPPLVLDVAHAAEVGPGEPCEREARVCAVELTCGAQGTCRAEREREMACGLARPLELVPGDEIRVTRELPAGHSLFEVSCAETVPRGREDVSLVTLPAGRWDVVLATRPSDERAAPEDMVLAVRTGCLDTRPSASLPQGCCDDVDDDSTRARLELRDLEGGTSFYLLASAVRSDPRFETSGLLYDLDARLRPVRAPGEPCDLTGTIDRCRSDRCTRGRCE